MPSILSRKPSTKRTGDEIYSVYKKAIDFKNINYPKSKLEIILAYEGLTLDI